MSTWLHALLLTTLVSAPAAAAPAWSPAVDGVRARLIATPTTDASKRPQLEIWLEIENVSDVDGGIDLPWGYVGDMLQLTVEEAGKEIPPMGIGGSHASGPPYIVALPVGATLRVPVSKNAYEYPQPGRVMFRPLTFQAWDIGAKKRKLTVRGTLKPHALDKGVKPRARAWNKPLDLPKLELP